MKDLQPQDHNRYFYKPFNRTHEPYRVVSLSEQIDPEMALRIRQMQGESYVKFRYVDPRVLEDGCLPGELDHSRGDDVTYFLAEPAISDMHGIGSARVVDGGFDSLFAASLDISQENRERITSYEREGRIVRELGATSLVEAASSAATFSIVREVFQRAIRNHTDDILLGSQTGVARRSYQRMFGGVVQEIGDGRRFETGYGRSVELTPVLTDTSTALDTLARQIMRLDPSDKQRRNLEGSLIFLCDGLNDDERSDEVNDCLSAAHHNGQGASKEG